MSGALQLRGSLVLMVRHAVIALVKRKLVNLKLFYQVNFTGFAAEIQRLTM